VPAGRIHVLHPAPNIIWVIQSRMGEVEPVARVEDTRNARRLLMGRIEREGSLGEYIN